MSERVEGQHRGAASLTTAEAEKEPRSGYLAFVAHEVRNPLSTALWSAELLARLDPAERAGARGQKLTAMSLRALQRLRIEIEDHFLADRLEVNGIPIRLESISLEDVLNAAAGKAAVSLLEASGVDRTIVRVDKSLFERALEGLLAVAGHGGTPVRVEATEEGGRAVIAVIGAAPSPDALRPPSRATPSDPTGRALSLHMALHVAQALGGQLVAGADRYLFTVPLAGSQGGKS